MHLNLFTKWTIPFVSMWKVHTSTNHTTVGMGRCANFCYYFFSFCKCIVSNNDKMEKKIVIPGPVMSLKGSIWCQRPIYCRLRTESCISFEAFVISILKGIHFGAPVYLLTNGKLRYKPIAPSWPRIVPRTSLKPFNRLIPRTFQFTYVSISDLSYTTNLA